MRDMIAYCGLDCEKCDAYLATINDDQALREKTAKLWSELNHAPILPEHINCQGCRVDGVKTVYCESLCGIRQCALQKGVTTCGDCPELESCQTVGAILSNNPRCAGEPEGINYISKQNSSRRWRRQAGNLSGFPAFLLPIFRKDDVFEQNRS